MSTQSKEELRVSVEYSKSGRSSCKTCKKVISLDSIRIGLEKRSYVHDGYDINYHHMKCFKFSTIYFLKQIKYFELLRWEDQMKLKELLNDKSEIKNQTIKENYYNDIWKIKDSLNSELKAAQIKQIFQLNYHINNLSPAQVVHWVGDGMTYGRIGPCPNCKCLTVSFDGEGFYCRGWVSVYSRCDWHGKDCKRYKFKLPSTSSSQFLKGFSFSHHHPIEELNDYKPPSHINPETGELTSASGDNNNNNDNNEDTQTNNNNNIIVPKPMPNPTSNRLKVHEEFSEYNSKKSFEIVVENSPTFGYTPYNIMMNLTDLITNNNSFYILQVIKCGTKYYCFCKWGRIGTEAGRGGGATDHQFPNAAGAINEFKEKFLDKSGFDWDNRHKFSKIPGKYYLVDLDDQEDEPELSAGEAQDSRPSNLPERVQTLVRTLFDERLMKLALAHFQFDVQKMPLGKISQSQIKSAYTVLGEIQNLIEQQDPKPSRSQFMDASARFYTLIPHRFDNSAIPPIDNKSLLIEKMKLIDAMSEVEVVNTLKKRLAQLKSSGNSCDDQYSQLNSSIIPLEKDSSNYCYLEEFALSTVDNDFPFNAEVMDIYQVDRNGETQIYKDNWDYCQNKMYLWHGSRTQNFVGVLSQGLKIAPKESPKTGYRFGKGVYFADCSSVSISYCGTSRENGIAILALSEVALGSSEALYQDSYMEKANEGYQSTKAMGSKSPSCFDQYNDINILRGPMISNAVQSSVVHNEYVVYNPTQINIKYLFVFKVNHKKKKKKNLN